MWRDTLRWGRWSLEHTWSRAPPPHPLLACPPLRSPQDCSRRPPASRGPRHVFITYQYFLPPFGDPISFFPPTSSPTPRTLPPPQRRRQAPGRSVYVPRHWLLINTWMWTGEGPAEGLDANRRQQDLQFKLLTDPLPLNPPTTPPPTHHHQRHVLPAPLPLSPSVTSVIEGRRMEGETQMWSHTLPHWPNTCTCTPSLLLISKSLRKSRCINLGTDSGLETESWQKCSPPRDED